MNRYETLPNIWILKKHICYYVLVRKASWTATVSSDMAEQYCTCWWIIPKMIQKDSVCSKRGTTEILWNYLLTYWHKSHVDFGKSKDLLDNLQSRSFSQVSSIKTFDFSTQYTTLPHDKLKTLLKENILKAFSHTNDGSKCFVLGYNSTYFSNKFQKGKTCYSEEQVISMLVFLIDSIFVSFGGALFRQWVRIVPLL